VSLIDLLFHDRAPRPTAPPPESAPLSIHPEPRFFVEAGTNPLTRICNVIDVSDGGVIGITGDRGAGKSVLLRKIGQRFSSDNLTINVSSPISGSKDMEFFLMLFRQLVQEVIEDLRRRIDRYGEDIREIGNRALKRERRRVLILGLLLALAASFAGLSVYDRVLLTTKADSVRQQYDQINDRIRSLSDSDSAGPIFGSLNAKMNFALAQLGTFNRWSPFAGSEYATTGRQKWVIQSLVRLTELLGCLLFLLFAYSMSGPIVADVFALYRASADERGLLSYAQQIAKKLDYELTRTADRSLEFSPFAWLKGTAKRSDQQKARALSLPELTSNYIEFVVNVRHVFPGKIIVCIDELDKISTVEEIAEILREIKGALYVEGTFYLLSISNDAMRSFEGRMGDTRDIFESTFDDVFPVRSLELDSCIEILKRRMEAGSEELRLKLHDDDALAMIAIFAAGNARDLIRCFRESVLSGQAGKLPDAMAIWSLLYTRRLDAIRDRALIAGGSPELRYILLPQLKSDIEESIHTGLGMTGIRHKLRDYFRKENLLQAEMEVALRFVRYAVEVEILLFAREILDLDASAHRRRATSYLMTAYQMLPLSLTDCEALLDAYPEYLLDSEAFAPSPGVSASVHLDYPVSERIV